MKQINLLIIILLFWNIVSAQRNLNTNAGKINTTQKSDTNARNQTQTNAQNLYQNQETTSNPFEFGDNNSVQLGAGLNYGNSLIKSDIMENGIGFSFKLGFNLLKKLESLPIALYAGLGFDYLYFGGKKVSQANSVNLAINSNAYGWYPYIDFDLGNNWPVTFFGTAFWGGRFFYTRQNITYFDAQNNKQTDTKNLEGDATQIFGYGGGVKFKVIKGLKLELRYQQNYGNDTKIIDPSSITFDSFGNLETYNNKYTDSDLGVYTFGLLINF